MYEYETSEQLFIDIWEKYGCPDEVYDSITIYNILNDLIVQSKHFVVLDHYSHINFDVIIKVEYDENNSLFKIYWQDNNKFRLAFIDHTLSDMDALQWEMFGFFTYEYFAIDIRKIKFVMVERHIFVLVQSNMITEKEMKKKIIGKNEIIDIERCTDKIYARYVFWEGDQNDLVKVSCIASNLPYFVCVIQPKENIPHTGISKKMLLVYTLDDIVERLKKVKMALLNEDLDRDELFAKGNTIRNIMEYTLKFFCVILDIPLNIEQKYGHIDLGELRKKIKEKVDIDLSQSIINTANELSHDSGKKYTLNDIREFYNDVSKLMDDIQDYIFKKEKII